MTDFQPPPSAPNVIHVHQGGGQPTNVLGVIGFVFVILGLVGMCFAPALVLGGIGAILCLIGVFREPRGLAIAGLIIGAIEVIVGVVIAFTVGLACGGCLWTAGEVAKNLETIEKGRRIQTAIQTHEQTYGEFPVALEAVENLDKGDLTDAWGQPIRYERTANGFRLYSLGSDQLAETADDVDLSREGVGASSNPSTQERGATRRSPQ